MKQLLRLCAAAIACLLPARASLGQTTLTTGLVTWLQFDDTAGPRALDASGTGKSGTLVNGGAWETARAGRAQGALHLTPGQYVSIPLAWRPARFSVAWWVHADSRREWNQTIRADYNGGDWGAFLFHTASDGAVYVGTDINTRLAAPAGTFQTGVWQHFAFTYDNGQARLYKNGALLTATTGMGAPAAWTRLTIGYGAPLDADGQYDDFRVYDRALTSAEVTQLRTSMAVAYTPPSNPSDDLDRNWSFVRSFDGQGNVIGESKSFSDALGRPTQAQAKSMTSGHILATQTINNSGGKGAVRTLLAPINNQEFAYRDQFVTAGGANYKWHNFEDGKANAPDPVDQSTPGTLGYYYSTNNTLEPLTATTSYPYSIGEEYTGPLGGAKRAASPGDELRMGRGHEARMREFPLLNELEHYLSLRPQFVAGTPVEASLRARGEKSVSVDVNGRESVVFIDADGKTLASCLSGAQYPGLTLTAAIHSDPANTSGLPPYQDLHIPAAGAVPLIVTGTGEIQVINLQTDVSQSHTLPNFVPGSITVTLNPGFYRVVSKRDNQALRYQARYGDFSYSFYDDAGRVVAAISPKGVGAPTGAATSSPTTGRAGHWSFDEAIGTTAADASGNNLGGTLMNQLSWNTNQSGSVSAIPASPAGGSFLVFDGQDDYVRMGDVPALRMSSTMSMEAWIYPTRDQSGIIINKENEYEVARFEDGSIQWAFNNASPGWNWINTGIIAPLNTWSHIGLTYDNGVVTAYLNGVQVGSAYNGAGNINYSAGEFWIGGRSCCTQFFHGAIDEVRMWSGVHQPSTSALGPLSYVTRNTYSGTGPLLATESTDEGRTEYVYTRDGRLRFSQSPVQRQQSKFSYTNYDEAGRVVESGEYAPTATVVGQLEAEQAQTNGQVEYSVPGASNGQDVGYLTEVGRYVLFQGYVGQSVPHALDFRYSAAGTVARTMSLYIDGVDVEQVRLPATGGWTNWATQRAVVNLAVGYHTIMLRMDADDSGWVNLDYLLGSALTGHVFESQLPVVQRYEAEAANTGCGQSSTPGQGSGCNPPATNHPGYHGSGFIGDLTSQGRFVEFTVNVPVAGRYPVHIRYAAALANSDRAMPVYVNWNYVFHANFAPTNSWSRWETQTIDVDLQAGSNLIRFQHDGRANEGWFNLDYIDVATPRQPASNSVLTIVEELMPTNSLSAANCNQRNQVWYDLPVADSQLGNRVQEFVLGAVAKTSTGSTTSWYSYDELGRLTWLLQEAPGVGVKSVDYTYDLNGNVLEVAYQKGQPDAFYHHYEYDADQRLRAAYTSIDGEALNRTLQARYFYYLHGPLKRVELGDRLQGIDYAYTIQGWVKGINQANRSLDPGADKPTNNGFYKDLFGLTLDYFSGDYQSRQLTLPQPYIWTNHNEMRHDGTVRASSWFTPVSANIHAYAYRYDAKGQLTQADYGQMNGGSYFSISGTKANEEGNLSYDAHGNIQTLRRRDGLGTATDDFLYDYTANTNKLAVVKSRTTNNAVLSYQYDANGQMVRETEAGQGDKYLTYDVSGKVTGVYRDEAHQQPLATFAYNDRGYRVSKTSYTAQGVASNVTYYVTDAQGNVLSTYEQPAGGNVAQTEIPVYAASRVGTVTRLDDGSLEPRYELNDQLGNARVVFRKPVTKKYTASMETSAASQEEADFSNLPATRVARATARSGFYVARLQSPLTTWGPTKELQMQKGDTLTFSAYASYFDGFTQVPGEARAAIAPYLAAGAAANGLTRLQTGPDATGRRTAKLGQLTAGLSITGLLHAVTQSGARTTSVPIAGIRLRIYEGSSTTVAEEITQPLTAVAASGWELLRRGYRMPYAGRIEVTTYNYDSGQHVYFDDLEVEHSTGLIVQEQHQYAFGSPITGLNYTVGNKMYRHGYQGQYAEKDEETGWDSFELRMYNSRIGRWTAPDPYGQYNSPYVGMGNNPVTSVDPDGGWADPFIRIVGNGLIHQSYKVVVNFAALAGLGKFAVQAGIGAGLGVARTAGGARQRAAQAYLLYNGTTVEWVEPGVSSSLYPATSGKKGYQTADKQHRVNKGPVEEGRYSMDISYSDTNPIRVYPEVLSEKDGVSSYGLTPYKGGRKGIQDIEDTYNAQGKIISLHQLWGTSRVLLNPLDGQKRTFQYLHNSVKGNTAGCIEISNALMMRLKEYGKTHSKMILRVKYPSYKADTAGGTENCF